MIKFAHIAPTNYLDLTVSNGIHLLLAHLVESDGAYREYYSNLDDGKTVILDNSAFEMYKQGREMYPSDKLAEMGRQVGADYVVMSDYPDCDYKKTICAAEQMAPELKAQGFGTFFVPQSNIGDLDGLTRSFEWASQHDLVDYVGVSILAVPNAYGVEKDNKLQRYLSRYHFMQHLERNGIIDKLVNNKNKVHFLGMVDGPNEISLVSKWNHVITSWDSSAAVWAGLNNISFDCSPTGLVQGKFEAEVDFSLERDDNIITDVVYNNINYINTLASGGVQ